jgi:NitT/TauT family transport system permease protein
MANTTMQKAPTWRRSAWTEQVLAYLLPAITFVLVVLAWEMAVQTFGIPIYLLPSPSLIFEEFVGDLGFLFRIGMVTFGEAVGGFAIGCLLGCLVAAVCVRWPLLAEGLVPLAVAASAIPIIALSPLLGIWLGSTTMISKMAVVAVMCFFPTLVNVYRGLASPHPHAIQLLRSYAASELTIFRKLRIPAALPYLFNALKICSTLSMIGAVVAEFFGGPRNSLGVYIKAKATILHTPEAWAAILVACILGIAFYMTIVIAERVAMPWHTRR